MFKATKIFAYAGKPVDISYSVSDGKPTQIIEIDTEAEYDNSNSFYILIIFVLILLFGLGFYFATKKS